MYKWVVDFARESVHLGNRQLRLGQLEDEVYALTFVVRVQKTEFLGGTLHLYTRTCVALLHARSPYVFAHIGACRAF